MKLLYYVALPFTQEILNLAKLFSIRVSNFNVDVDDYTEELGLFIYSFCLTLEAIDDDSEWLLDIEDALQVLALYANKDFNGVCEYLNSIPNKPFTVHVDAAYFNYKI